MLTIQQLLADTHQVQSRLYRVDQLTLTEREAWLKEYALQLIHETGEALDEVNWKHHKTERKEVDKYALLEELVDCQKFLMNMFYVMGYSPADIRSVWNVKTLVVLDRMSTQQLKVSRSGMNLLGRMDTLESEALAQLKYELQETRASLADAERNLQVLQNEIEALR